MVAKTVWLSTAKEAVIQEPYTQESSGPIIVITKTDNYTLTLADLGKCLRMNSTSDKTFTSISMGASEDGQRITIMKVNTGRVTFQTVDTDTVRDSSGPGTIYNADPACTWGSLTLEYVHAKTKWVVIGSDEGWVTT